MRFIVAAALVAIAAVVAACSGTRATNTQVYSAPPGPISELRVLYLHGPLRWRQTYARTPAAQLYAPTAEQLGYTALPGFIEARTPPVLTANGLSGFAKSSRPTGPTGNQAREALAADGARGRVPLLVMSIVNGESMTTQAGSTVMTLKLQAHLFDEAWSNRLWAGDFDLTLRQTRSLGYTLGIDEKFVDEMLGKVIAQLREDGYVRVASR